MSHTDDGTLHTWLDGELEAADEARLREHLATCAECRGRLDVARVTRTRAHEILRYADPVRIEQPDFTAVLARRSAGAGGPAVATKPGAGTRVRPLLLPWAASLVLAVGAGWFAQELLRGGGGVGGDAATDRVATFQAEEARVQQESAAASPFDGDASVARGAESSAATTGAAQPESQSVAPPAVAAAGRAGDTGAPAGASIAVGAAAPTPAPTAESRAPAQSPAEASPLTLAEADEAEDLEPLAAVSFEDVTVTGAADRRAEQPSQLRTSVRARTADAAADAAPPPPPPPPAGVAAMAVGRPWPASWRSVDATGAAAVLGATPSMVEGLPVAGYEAATDGSATVRLTQALPGGQLLELLQRREEDAPPAPPLVAPQPAQDYETYSPPTGPASIPFVEDRIELLIRAPVSLDSLQRLRARVR